MRQFKAKAIHVNKLSDFAAPLSALRRSMDKRFDSCFQTAIENAGSPLDCDLESLKIVNKFKPFSIRTDDKALFHYHNLLASQLNEPESWLLFPIVDSLSFTAHATKNELEKLDETFSKSGFTNSNLKVTRSKVSRKAYAEESEIRNYYKHTVKIQLVKGEKLSSPIYFSYGLKKKNNDKELKQLRFSLNPARMTPATIASIFKALNDTNLFEDFAKTLCKSVVTRVDLAVDFLGLPVSMMIVGQTNITHYETYPFDTENEFGDKIASSQYIGDIIKTHIVIYSKLIKQLEKQQNHIIGLCSPERHPYELTRYEWCFKPQGNNRESILLPDLTETTFMFRAKRFFSPLLYREYRDYKLSFYRQGVMRTLAEMSKSIKVPGKQKPRFDATPQKHQRYRMDQINSMLDELDKFKMHLNYEWFKDQQLRTLTALRDCIFCFSHQ